VLIDLPFRAFERRLEATQRAMSANAPAIYEAAFLADEVFVAIILVRESQGWKVVEVKSTTSVEPSPS
jgi:hypothetical protein